MAAIVCELKWLHHLLSNLCIIVHMPTTLYCDNLATIHIMANPVFHELTKHIELDYHLVMDKILGAVVIGHLPSLR